MEPTLEQIEDYNGQESNEKRLTVYIVILSGLLIGAIYGIIASNTSVSDALGEYRTNRYSKVLGEER